MRSCKERRVCSSFSHFCVSRQHTSPLCSLVGRHVCPSFSHFCVSPVYQPFVWSCRERRVCPHFCVSHQRTSLLCSVSHQRTSLLCSVLGRDMCVPHFHILCLPLAYQPFVWSCKDFVLRPDTLSMHYNKSIIIAI